MVARDPFEVLVRAVNSLNVQEQIAMRDALHHVLTTIAASGARRHFGVCQDCTHLGGEVYCDSTSASRTALGCLLFGAPIEPDDAGLLCVHFQPKRERREDGHLIPNTVSTMHSSLVRGLESSGVFSRASITSASAFAAG